MITPDQRALFHCWCREIAGHLVNSGVPVSEEMVKELVLLKLGNTKIVLGEKIAMRSSKYKPTGSALTIDDLRREFIAFDGLLLSMQAWAATDLNLELISPNEE